jgi:two-component system cell cycle response regulator DivK
MANCLCAIFHQEADPTPSRRSHYRGSPFMNAVASPGKRILVIDDCAATCEMIHIILSVEGYTVTSAPNGEEALRQLQTGPLPDLLLVDLSMPVMTGWDFLRRKKQDPRLASIPFLIFSALGQGGEDLETLGAAGSITKPIDEDSFIDSVLNEVRSLAS